MRTWFLSDLHLKKMKERNSKKLLRFLHSIVAIVANDLERKRKDKYHIFFLGDIFDLWVSDHNIFLKEYEPIISAVSKLRELNVNINYFEGNHDLHLDVFWEQKLGVNVYEEALLVKLDKITLRVEHGDLINQNDHAYLRLRRFLRSFPVEFLGHKLPGKLWEIIGSLASQKSRKRSQTFRSTREDEIRKMIRSHAEKSYNESHFDLIVTGHMHVFDDYKFSGVRGKIIRSINLGSWENEARVLELNNGKVYMKQVEDYLTN